MDDITDGLKGGGVEGYFRAVERDLGFGWRFRLALRLQRTLGWQKPLARHPVTRFVKLLAGTAVLRAESTAGLDQVEPVVGTNTTADLRRLMERRLALTERAFQALKRQYPDYADALQQWHINRIALRLEHKDYRDMQQQSVISLEVFQNLEADLDSRALALEALPQLDLGLEPRRLVERVPFLQGLDAARLDEIARLLQPRLAYPGEVIMTKGTKGDCMYFLASGAVDVSLGGGAGEDPVVLGSGEFFGEIALLRERPRTATVTASTFSDLLVLQSAAFKSLLDRYPEIRATIEEAAADRLEELGEA